MADFHDLPLDDKISSIWPPYNPQDMEQRTFWRDLWQFWEMRGTPLSKVPRVGHKDLDLYKIWERVTSRGGLMAVIEAKRWREIALKFDFPPTCTNSAYMLRVNYTRYLYPYELFRQHGKTLSDINRYIEQHPTDFQRGPAFSTPRSANALKNAVASLQRTGSSSSASTSRTPITPTTTTLRASARTPATPSTPYNPPAPRQVASAPAPAPVPFAPTNVESVQCTDISDVLSADPDVKDYSISVRAVGSKRPLDASIAGIAPKTKRPCIVPDPEIALQNRIAAAITCGVPDSLNWGFASVKLLSYAVDMVVPSNSKLLDALAAVLKDCRVYLSGGGDEAAGDDAAGTSYLLFGRGETSARKDRSCAEILDVEPSRSMAVRQRCVVDAVYNISMAGENKKAIAAHEHLLVELAHLLHDAECREEERLRVMDALSLVAKQVATVCAARPRIIAAMKKALDDADPKISMVALEYFVRLSERSENEQVFVDADSSFYRSLLHLLCPSPMSQTAPFVRHGGHDRVEASKRLRVCALSLLHNLSSFKGQATERVAAEVHVMMDLMRCLLDPPLSLKAALTLLNFSSFAPTVKYLAGYESQLILFVYGDGEVSLSPRTLNVLLKVLTRIEAERVAKPDP